MAKKPKTNREKYVDLVSKIKRRYRDIEKRGYVPIENFFKEEPPKRVLKKHLEKLENIVENIYQFAKYYDPIQNEYILGTERRKQEYSIAARKGWETRRENEAKRRYEQMIKEELESAREQAKQKAEELQRLPHESDVILKQIEDLINNWTESTIWSEEFKRIKRRDRNTLKSIFDGALMSLGREQVAANCNQKPSELISIVQWVLYASGSAYKEYSAREGIQVDLRTFTEIIYGRPLTVAESRDISDMMERMNESE